MLGWYLVCLFDFDVGFVEVVACLWFAFCFDDGFVVCVWFACMCWLVLWWVGCRCVLGLLISVCLFFVGWVV